MRGPSLDSDKNLLQCVIVYGELDPMDLSCLRSTCTELRKQIKDKCIIPYRRSIELYITSAKYGHLRILQRTYNHVLEPRIIDKATTNGHLHILKWIYRNSTTSNFDFFYRVYVLAGNHGHLHILQWAVNIYCDASVLGSAFAFFAYGNHLDCVQLCIKYGASDFNDAFSRAFENRHIPMMKYLLDHTKEPIQFMGYNTEDLEMNYFLLEHNMLRHEKNPPKRIKL